MSWYLAALRKYASFGGRARRKEYWYFFLCYLLIALALAIVDGLTGSLDEDGGLGLLSGLFVLAMFIPSISVGVRRLHDIGRSGWWLLISFVPVVGAIVLLVFALRDGDAGDNEYGPSPKATF